MDKPLVVIPAKGTSTGILRKMMKPVLGRPLLWYTLNYVIQLGLSDEAVVVTDDDEIDAFVLEAGCGVGIVREPHVSPKEENSLRAVYRAVLSAVDDGRQFRRVVVLQPTQPVRPLDLVGRCVKAVSDVADGAISMHQSPTPREFMSNLDPNGIVQLGPLKQRQRYEIPYVINGMCFAYNKRAFDYEPQSLEAFHAKRTYRAVITNSFPFVDIDEDEDLEYFEMLLRAGKTYYRIDD